MSDIEGYRTDFLEEVRATAAQGEFTHEAFTAVFAKKLVEAEELSDFTPCYYRDKGYRRRDLAVDGFLLDDLDVDSSVTLIVGDFRGKSELESITASQMAAVCDKALYFAEDAIQGRLQDLEPSKSYYDLADWLYSNSSRIASIRIYVLTDALLSTRTKELPSRTMEGLRVDIHIWDIGRLFRTEASGGREPIDIDVSEFIPSGLPVLRASKEGADYDAFLSAIPASVLADMYERYGSRLLEGNVRSFLSVRGAVNKGIRETILGEPTRFFAYNNGVAATATEVDVSRAHGVERLTRLRDLQIVNGAQTTASLFTSRRKDGADLSKIFVPLKLSVVAPTMAGELIPKISRYANSQNKVSEADFFANHPFHRRLEAISRQVWAPPAHGNSYQTKWFYERARGQYLNEQAGLSAAKRKTYQIQHPKNQVITKTDLAKYVNSWARFPDVVSLGAQKNFVRFAESIAPQWEASDAQFNERWFKHAVGKAILFATTERIVSSQPWYQGGYRANVVTYTVALLSHMIEELNKRFFDFDQLWRQQALPKSLEHPVAQIASHVFEVIVAPPANFANVTEWCKKEACWERVKQAPPHLDREFSPYLSTAAKEVTEKTDAKKAQRLDTQLGRLTYIVKQRGQNYWLRALEFNGKANVLSEKEKSILSLLAKKRGFVPSDLQAKVVIEAEQKLQVEGFR